MRVLYLNRELSARGGAARWLLDLLAGVQGHLETLLLVGRDDGSVSAEERSSIGPWRLVRGLDAGRPGRRPRAAALDALRQVLGEFRPRLIHCNDVLAPEILELVAASGRGLVTVQDHRFFCPGRGKLDWREEVCRVAMNPDSCGRCLADAGYTATMLELTRRRLDCLAGMKRIIVLSDYMARELENVGVPAGLVRVVPPAAAGCFLELAGSAEEDRVHLYAGRLAHHKGIEVALRAARRLPEGARLLVAGDGPLAGQVASVAEHTDGKVVFLGWQDRPALCRLLSRARTLWMPSLWPEPFGISGIEALAAGVPVIGTNAGGIPEWLEDGRVGYLFKPADHDTLAQLATSLGNHREQAGSMGQQGRLLVSARFTMEREISEITNIYNEIA